MNLGLRLIDVAMLAGYGLIAGIVLNSRNTIGIVNATGNLFVGMFNAAGSTVRA